MVTIDHLLKIAHADWMAWAIVMCFIIFLLSIGVAAENGLDATTEERCRAAVYATIILGWFVVLLYWFCSIQLSQAKRLALQSIGCDNPTGLVQRLSLILSGDGSKADGVSVAWPQGWSHSNPGGIVLRQKNFFTKNVLRILTGFMLWSNVYFAIMMCIMIRTAYASFNQGVFQSPKRCWLSRWVHSQSAWQLHSLC